MHFFLESRCSVGLIYVFIVVVYTVYLFDIIRCVSWIQVYVRFIYIHC